MARIDTVTESNGPDRFNLHVGCADHHAGVKTGIKDYCCCCDPCQYIRRDEEENEPRDRHCCRCNPKIIVAKFTATNEDGCCRDLAIPMFITQVADVSGQLVMLYSGTIVGHTIYVYLSNRSVDSGQSGYLDEPGCRWTIRIPSLGIDEEILIDHTIVTCLGVPHIEVTGVSSFETCEGTLSLLNFPSAKVPFRTRTFPDLGYNKHLLVPFPSGYTYEGCAELPRFICVTKRRSLEDHIRQWEVEWWREFQWDDAWVPYHDATHSEDVIGRWKHQPEDPSAYLQSLYLIQDASGETWLQPDFATPAGTQGEGEYYKRVTLSSCDCALRILDVRPIIDLSTPPDFLGIDYRAGRCGCWDYVCGRRRCVPKYFCGFVFIGGTIYKNILFTWDVVEKCWLSSGGVDLDGGDMPISLRICLTRGADGSCVLSTSYEDYELSTASIGNDDMLPSGVIDGTNAAGDSYFVLSFSTSLDGSCKTLFTCVIATPCNTDCGSHPPVLYLTLHGSSTGADIPPPPITGDCTTEIALIYFQRIVVTVDPVTKVVTVLYTCGYVGYALVESFRIDDILGPTWDTYLIKAELDLGNLTITRRLAATPDVIELTESINLDTETCNPYHGTYASGTALRGCFFGNNAIIWHRYTADIVE